MASRVQNTEGQIPLYAGTKSEGKIMPQLKHILAGSSRVLCIKTWGQFMQFLTKLTRFRFSCFDQSCFSQQAALVESWSVRDSFVYVIKSSLVS